MKMKPFSNHSRRLVPVLLTTAMLLGLFLPFVYVQTAFLALESAAICSSTIGCVRWRFFGGTEALLREELTRALLEATNSNDGGGGFGVGIGTVEGSNSDQVSFENLVKEMASNRQDMKAFAFMTKAMIMKMENNVRKAKWQESIYWHLAAHGAPKSLNCLSLNLAEEYAVNSIARARLPLPQYVYRFTDPSFHHVVLLTDNVLAASVVISSTIKASINPQNLVFHVVTDKKTYTSMHAYFAVNKVDYAVVEVKGLHQYDWSREVNIGIQKMLDIHRQIWDHNYRNLKNGNHIHKLDFLSSSSISLLNHIRVYLPELFPDLDKVVFLDDDIVVQRDLSSLWNLNLNQKVMGAVVDSWCGQNCCPGRKYKDYFNFSYPIISLNLDQERCGFLYGMNVFDLKQWRKTNITAVYHQWLKHSLDCGFTLWHPGALAPALIAFESHVHQLDHSWHVAGLGQRHPLINKREVKAAVSIHFSGPAKPWLEIASPEVRGLWNRHLNLSNEYIRKCGITV